MCVYARLPWLCWTLCQNDDDDTRRVRTSPRASLQQYARDLAAMVPLCTHWVPGEFDPKPDRLLVLDESKRQTESDRKFHGYN